MLLCVAAGLLSPDALANALSYRIEGVVGPLRENLRAHLGAAPADRAGAERFLVTAPARAARALEALGYYEASVDIAVDRSRTPWRVTLTVVPGEVLAYTAVSVTVTGEGEADPEFQRLVASRTPALGSPVHHGRYEDLKTALQQLARQRGYFDATLETHRVAIDVTRREATLTLAFATGPRYHFGELLADDALLAPDFLARLQPWADAEHYSQRSLLELRQRLLRLGYYASVVVLPEVQARADGSVPIRIDVLPAPRHSYEVGVGFSTDTRQRLSLLWRTPHINRFGHSQQTSLRWSPVNPELRTAYSIPLDAPANDVLQIIGRLEDNEFGDLNSVQQELALRRELTMAGTVVSGQARALREEWNAVGEDFGADFVLGGVSYARRDRRGDAVDPDAGLSQFYEVEVASRHVGSDEDLLRLHGELVGVRRLGEAWRVVSRAEGGLLFSSSSRPDEIPPSLAFFAGGDNSIRGYGYQSVGRETERARLGEDIAGRALVVGGTRLLTGSLELQRYLTPTWRVAVFADAGDAFVGENFDLNVGVGIGVHYLSPVGALRFEIADPVTSDDRDWRVHINIGAEF